MKKKKTNLLCATMTLCLSMTLALSETTFAKDTSINIATAVPADSWGAIVIKNLSALSKQIDDYSQMLNVEPVNLQKRVIRKLGVGKLVKLDRPIAIAVLNKQLYGDQPIAMILSVSEYEKLAAALNGQVTDTPGVMEGKSEELGKCYFARKNSLVVIGPTQMIVNAVISSKQSLSDVLNNDAKQLLESSQIYVHVNLPALVTLAKPFLMMFSAMGMMGSMQMNPMLQGNKSAGNQAQPGGIDAKQMQQMQAVSSMINAMVSVLDELNSLDISANLKPDMIQFAGLLEFKPNLEISNLLKLQKPTPKPLLVGLPSGDFAVTMGFKWKGKLTKFQEAMIRANSIFLQNPADVQKYLELAKKSAEMVTSSAFKLTLVKPIVNHPAILVQIVQNTTNAKEYLNVMSQLYAMTKNISVPGQKDLFVYDYKKSAEQINGLPVDKLVIDLSGLIKKAQSAEDAVKGLKSVLGSTKIEVKFVPVTEKIVAIQFGGDNQTLNQLISAAKSGSTALNSEAKIVEIANLLPKERICEAYLNMGSVISGIMNIITAAASTVKPEEANEIPQIPPMDTALIGKTLTVSGSALKGNVVIPVSVIKELSTLKTAIQSFKPEMKELEEKIEKD